MTFAEVRMMHHLGQVVRCLYVACGLVGGKAKSE